MKLTVLKRGKDVDDDMGTDIDFVSLLKARDTTIAYGLGSDGSREPRNVGMSS